MDRNANLEERLKIEGAFILKHVLKNVLTKMCLAQEISIDQKAIAQLLNYNYEGNYIELENILLGAVISS